MMEFLLPEAERTWVSLTSGWREAALEEGGISFFGGGVGGGGDGNTGEATFLLNT